jgi:AraC-like DNA-binding protein
MAELDWERLKHLPSAVVSTNTKMAELLLGLAVSEGLTDSRLEAVSFMRANSCFPRAPVIYEPSIVIVAQGRKRGYVGDRSFIYDANNYLVLSVPLPFECETEASATSPMLGIKIRVDPTVIAELLLELDDTTPGSGDVLSGVSATPLNETLLDATTRLLECLSSPSEARILGPQIVREITFRVLCGEQADALKALVTRRSKFAQIAKTLKRIHTEFSARLDVESLAEEADMSVSAFHHNFKVVTSTAPLQYIKSVRLHKARTLMVHEGLSAQAASNRVGYESPSQFSREFKRLFGNAPAEEAARMKARLA